MLNSLVPMLVKYIYNLSARLKDKSCAVAELIASVGEDIWEVALLSSKIASDIGPGNSLMNLYHDRSLVLLNTSGIVMLSSIHISGIVRNTWYNALWKM